MPKHGEVTINFDLKNFEKNLLQHKKLLAVILVGILVFFIGTTSGLIPLNPIINVVNPGFEGAKANCYGVEITSGTAGMNPAWTGIDTVQYVGSGQSLIASGGQAYPPGQLYNFPSVTGISGEVYQWGAGSGSSQMTVQHIVYGHYDNGPYTQENQIATDVESNIQLQDFNVQNSTPLNYLGAGDWTNGTYLEYWQETASSVVNNGVNSTTYSVQEQDVLLVPGDFHLDIWIPPIQTNANTGSGWEEGSWTNIEFWYMISWYQWLNSLGPVIQGQNAPPPVVPLTYQEKFTTSGGVPISAWIQEYTMPIQTATGQVYDMLSVDVANSGSKSYTTQAGSTMPANIYSDLVGMVENGFQPSLNGRYMDLYAQPSDNFTYVQLANPSDLPTYAVGAAPDAQTEPPNQFFKIGVVGFGTDVANGWLGLGPYTVYYPEVSYLIRVVMAVYGTHTYVWTVSTATQQGYNSVQNGTVTSGWQNRTVAVTTGGSGLSVPAFGWPQFFSPLNLEVIFIILAAIVILAIIFNPGVLNKLMGNKQGQVKGVK
jgi:hypothetical protein